MCGNTGCCKREGEKVRDPKKCSPEQIQECHGNATEHPCVEGKRQCEAEDKE